jgi:hypothetical protein
MGSSAFEIILVPVLWGTLCGIASGVAIVAVMNAVDTLIDWLGRRARSMEEARRAPLVAQGRASQPVVRTGRPRRLYG